MNKTYYNRRKNLIEKLTTDLIKELKQDSQVYNEITIYAYLNRALNAKLQHKIVNKKSKNKPKNVPVLQFNKFGSKIGKFKSYAEAQLYTGVKAPSISNVINGKRLTAGGYYWKPA